MKRALVLSGGGARGAYQIGVWKALKELSVNFDIVTGTSVGALNGALMVQDTYQLAEDFWHSIDFGFVFNDAFFKDKELTRKKLKLIRKYAHATIVKKGLDITELEKNVDKYLDKEIFYSSNIDYGLVTFDLRKRKPVMLTKKDIPEDRLTDYIVASATFYPFFKKKNILDKYYVDGGFYDNLPINLAIEMGATEVIAVYIGVFGLLQRVKNKDIPITYIKPKSRLGSPLSFNSDNSKRGLKLGYNDTMTVFSKCDGNIYTFKKNSILETYNVYKLEIKNKLDIFFKNNPGLILNRKLKNYKNDISSDDFIEGIELLGNLLNIDVSEVYDIKEFNKLLISNFEKFDDLIKQRKIKIRESKIFRNRKHMIRKIYDELLEIDNKKSIKKIRMLSNIYPRVMLGATYLKMILDENKDKEVQA